MMSRTDLPIAPVTTNVPPAEPDGAELRCPQCDYDLRAMASERCPECGMPIDRAALRRSQIPWTYRSDVGRLSAYGRTAWMVFWRPRRFAAEVSRPVRFEDARAFRNVTVWLAFLPLAGLIVWAFVSLMPGRPLGFKIPSPASAQELALFRPDVAPDHLGAGIVAQAAVAIAAACGLWLFLLMATAVGSYFFHPGSLSITRQNRAVSLSYYTCAPLAAMPLTALLGAATVAIGGHTSPAHLTALRIFALMNCLTFGLLAAQVAAWWRCSVSMLHQTTRCSMGRVVALGAFLPVAWIALGLLVVVGVTLFVLLIAVVALSLM